MVVAHLFAQEEPSVFPEIDAAWEEAKRSLAAADVDLQAVPLFLVLGRPHGGRGVFVPGCGLPFTVKQVPRPDAPVQVWANKQDGIFVTCVDNSRLGSRASLLALTSGTASSDAPLEPPSVSDDDRATSTIGAASPVQRIFGGLIKDEQLTEEERRRRYQVHEAADKPEESRRLTARLEHLCRLVVKDRWPEPPVNGILVLIPHAATQSKQAAEGTSRDCQHDLSTVWKVFRLHCPLMAPVCDLETVPGFPTFLDAYLARFRTEEEKRKERKRRLGRRLGWGVGLEVDPYRHSVEEQVQWIGKGLLPQQIYEGLFRLETPGREDTTEVVRRNFQLCRFLSAMHEGQKHLTSIVVNGLVSKAGGQDLLGGCYLAATGRDASHEQAFVAGVFDRLLESISNISWSEEAIKEEEQYQLWTRFGYLGLPIFAVVMLLLVIYLWSYY